MPVLANSADPPGAIMNWHGSKWRLVRRIVEHFPPASSYDCFVDLFGGSAAVTVSIPQRTRLVKVYNDVDSELVNFFRVLRDPAKAKELIRRLRLTPHSREEFCSAIRCQPKDEIERAWRLFVLMTQAVSGASYHRATPGNFGYSRTTPEAEELAGKVDRLWDWVERLRAVTIEHLDYRDAIRRYDGPRTLFYADPPYLTRYSNTSAYAHEMTTVEEHKEMVDALKGCAGLVVISGYPNKHYEGWLERDGWRRIDFRLRLLASGTGSIGDQKEAQKPEIVESIWLSPRVVAERARAGIQAKLFEETSDTGEIAVDVDGGEYVPEDAFPEDL